MRPARQIHVGHRLRLAAVLATAALGGAACASETPLERLQRELDPFAEYSVILQDMRPEGFYHQYRVVVGHPDRTAFYRHSTLPPRRKRPTCAPKGR